MKCLFCPELDTVESDSTETNGIICYTHHCHRCETDHFVVDNFIKGWQFCVMEYRKYRYWISWTEMENHTKITGISLNDPTNGLKKIINIAGQTNLTPHNILQKLKLYITFS
jgi:hypothetical protein